MLHVGCLSPLLGLCALLVWCVLGVLVCVCVCKRESPCVSSCICDLLLLLLRRRPPSLPTHGLPPVPCTTTSHTHTLSLSLLSLHSPSILFSSSSSLAVPTSTHCCTFPHRATAFVCGSPTTTTLTANEEIDPQESFVCFTYKPPITLCKTASSFASQTNGRYLDIARSYLYH